MQSLADFFWPAPQSFGEQVSDRTHELRRAKHRIASKIHMLDTREIPHAEKQLALRARAGDEEGMHACARSLHSLRVQRKTLYASMTSVETASTVISSSASDALVAEQMRGVGETMRAINASMPLSATARTARDLSVQHDMAQMKASTMHEAVAGMAGALDNDDEADSDESGGEVAEIVRMARDRAALDAASRAPHAPNASVLATSPPSVAAMPRVPQQTASVTRHSPPPSTHPTLFVVAPAVPHPEAPAPSDEELSMRLQRLGQS